MHKDVWTLSKPHQTHQLEAKSRGRSTWNRKATKGDVDVVLSRSEGDVLHTAAAILVVLTAHLRFRWTLNGEAQSTSSSTSEKQWIRTGTKASSEWEGVLSDVPGLNSEAVRCVDQTLLQAWTEGSDSTGIAAFGH